MNNIFSSLKAIIQCSVWLFILFSYSTHTLATQVRVGILQYGTVHWELDVIKHHELIKKEGIELEVVQAASSNAVNVMLQSGRVDLVVGDWIWVSRQRNEGRGFTSFPYSLAEGSLMVHPDSGIKSIDDLKGKKVGIAGGEVNKNWLITRAYSLYKSGIDLQDIIKPAFAAPPLLNQLMLRGDFDAVLNFWHYSAKLEAMGMTPLISVDEMLDELSISHSIPLLVWIFRQDWADKNPELLSGFLNASFAAKRILVESDTEWERIKPLTKASDPRTLKVLRETYRSGVPFEFGEQEIKAATTIFSLLAKLAGNKLVGDNPVLNKGTFYTRYTIN